MVHMQKPASLKKHLILQIVNALCVLKLLLHLCFAKMKQAEREL